jgi:hypothetical protein
MPTIEIIDSIKILMYFRDHMPPHFHVEYNEYEVTIDIRTLEKLEGKMPGKPLKKALSWAKKNQGFLMEKWNEMNPNAK